MQRIAYNKLPGRTQAFHAAITRVAPCVETRPHRHDYYEFFQVLSGTGFHRLNGQNIPLERGHLAMVCPADSHCYATLPDQTLVFINIAFPARWWQKFTRLFTPPLTWRRFNQQAVPGHILLPKSQWQLRESSLMTLLGKTEGTSELLIRTCLRMVEAFAWEKPPHCTTPDWLLELRRDMGNPILLRNDIHFWQKRSAKSPEHLARCCRQYLGRSLTELLNEARVELAKQRLCTSHDKLITIAYEAGFQNLGYFHRLFRRLNGCTPKQWQAATEDPAVPM